MLTHDKNYKVASNVLVVLFVVSTLMMILAFTAPKPTLAAGGGNQTEGCCCTKEWKTISYPCSNSCINGDIHPLREYDRYRYYRWCDPCAGACGGWIFYDWQCLPCW